MNLFLEMEKPEHGEISGPAKPALLADERTPDSGGIPVPLTWCALVCRSGVRAPPGL